MRASNAKAGQRVRIIAGIEAYKGKTGIIDSIVSGAACIAVDGMPGLYVASFGSIVKSA